MSSTLSSAALSDFEPGVDSNCLLTMIRGYRQSLFLHQAFQTGIFEFLEETPTGLDQLAARSGYREDRLVFLLDALVSLGLVEKSAAGYAGSPLAMAHLRRRSRFYLGDLMEMEFSPQQAHNWSTLQAWLKGKTNANGHDPAAVFQPSFVRAMAQGVLSSNSLRQTVAVVAGHPCFAGARRLLDLGGGHGLFSLALKRLKPELEAMVFDMPRVEAVTREYARHYAVDVAFQAGDFYRDELPAHQDIVLAFDILHPVPPIRKEEVFGRVYRALGEGGHLFYKLWFLDDSRTRPARAAIFALSCGMKNHGSYVYTLKEAEAMLQRVGFRVKNAVPAGDAASTIIIARKEG